MCHEPSGTLSRPATSRRRARRRGRPAHVERHGGLDVVPRIGVATVEPRESSRSAIGRRESTRRSGDRPRRRGRGGEVAWSPAAMLQVHDEALSQNRVEDPLGNASGRRVRGDVPDQEAVIERGRRMFGRSRARRGSGATSRGCGARGRGARRPQVPVRPRRAWRGAAGGGRCGRGRPARCGSGPRAPS